VLAYARDRLIMRHQESNENLDRLGCVNCGEPFDSRGMETMCPMCLVRSQHRS